MDDRTPENTSQRFWAQRTGGKSRWGNPDGSTRILEIQRAEKIKRAAITQHAEGLCAIVKDRNDAVLERLGRPVQPAPLPSLQLPTFSRSRGPSLGKRTISPLSNVPHLNVEANIRNQKSPEICNPDSFWDEIILGSQMAVLACTEMANGDKSTRCSSSTPFTSEDAHTPDELRAIPRITSPDFTFTPAPPPRASKPCRRRASRLPVLAPGKSSGEDKEVANGCRLQTATAQIEAIVKRLEHTHLPSVQPCQPKTVAKRSPAVAPLVPTPPTVPQTKRKGTRPGTFLRATKNDSRAGKKPVSNCSLQIANRQTVELQPLGNPAASLSLCFTLISSEDWEKKIQGLKMVQALAQHHAETLMTKLHEVCLVVIEEVKNLRSAVACAAMDVLGDMYVHLQKTMDPELELTGKALLLKLAQTTNAFIHTQANLALDAMVQNCSYGRIVTALLNTGLRHPCIAVRGSTARHLHQLADSLGAARVLSGGKSFTWRFLNAVANMSVDAAPDVRHDGQAMLRHLACENDFMNLWENIVPEKQRRPLDKIFKQFN